MKIAYDATLRRPACVLIAAALGANPDIAKLFDADTWLIEVTPELRVYEINGSQLDMLLDYHGVVRA